MHGTCLGFEALAVIVSRDVDILSSFDSFDNASPLILTEDGQSGSAFFGSLPGEVLQAVQEKPLTMENHGRGEHLSIRCLISILPGVVAALMLRAHWWHTSFLYANHNVSATTTSLCPEGLGMKAYNGSKALQDFFKVVSLSVDKGDVAYISTLEARRVGTHTLPLVHPVQLPITRALV